VAEIATPDFPTSKTRKLQNQNMKTATRILIVSTALSLTGCAAWNKYDIRNVSVTAPDGSKSVAVAVVDERLELKQGDIGPELIGVTRSGYGIPYRVKTATKAPLAQEIAGVIVRGFGPNRKLAPPMSFADPASAQAALRGTGTDRQVLIRIQRFNSDTLIRTELDYAVVLEVYDSQGHLLASATRSNTANLGGNAFLPALHARQAVLQTTGTVLSDLLSTPEIRSALQ
jgi:hypothetical protein